jgi:alpha-amylase
MRRGLKQWGSWLVTNIHFGGFRFDYTEGVEPWYVWEWLNYPSQRPLFGFMEYWANANAVEMRTWLHLTGWEAAIYDWNLQKLLEGMCEDSGTSFDMSELQAPSLLGVEAGYTVTFVENHDTLQPPDETGIATNKQLAYAYIMHSQGLPLVFYHDYYDQPYYVGGTNYAGVPLKPEIDRLILIRKATVAGRVAYLNTNADLFIQQRDGGGRKPGSILVINDHPSSTLTNQVQTVYTNQWLIDLVSSNQATLIQTDTNGYVNLAAPPRDYRIYGLTNSITE